MVRVPEFESIRVPRTGAVLVAGWAAGGPAPDPRRQAGGSGGGGGGGGGGRRLVTPQGPVPVLVGQPAIADVPLYLEGVGTTRAFNLVIVHSQVDGKLISINFREGEDVRRGDVLARIDPITYQAQLDQALAKKQLDEAQLANVKLDLERYTSLVRTT